MSSNEKSTPHSHSVMLTNPGSRLSFQTALGLQKAGLLQKFVTSFYYDESGAMAQILAKLPRSISSSIEKEFKRRSIEGLNVANVSSAPLRELPFVLARRFNLPKPFYHLSFNWRLHGLIAHMTKNIRQGKPKAVISCDAWGVDTFQAAEEVGALKILDQNTGHVVKAREILHKERELHPDWADGIPTFPDKLVDRCIAEVKMADNFLVSSDYARQTLLEQGRKESEIFHIPYAADISRFCPLEDESQRNHDNFRFVYVGNISQRKGIKYLLDAFKALNEPRAELQIVGVVFGSGKGLVPYEGSFTHIPSVPHHQVHSYFQNADCLVYPSLHESGVLAIHEALACGVPVITTPNAGSIVEDGKSGFIVPIRDVDALVEKMQLIMREEELRREMKLQARARAEQFTWDVYRGKLGEAVRTILGEVTPG